jgi:hypothetical protein
LITDAFPDPSVRTRNPWTADAIEPRVIVTK